MFTNGEGSLKSHQNR